MHYKNGREARVGDRIVAKNWQGPYIGVVIDATPGSTACNLQVVPVPVAITLSETASQCLHVDDALPAEKPAEPQA